MSLVSPFSLLGPPQGTDIPFDIQAPPIHNGQFKYVQPREVKIETTYAQSNPLPFLHFTGPFPTQVNQPQFLSVNDQIIEHQSPGGIGTE